MQEPDQDCKTKTDFGRHYPLAPITPDEVQDIIKRLQPRKAPGSDGITNRSAMERDGLPLYPSATENQVQIKKFNPKVQAATQSTNSVQQIPETMPAAPAKQLLGPENTVTTCQFCHASIKTAVKYTTTSRTHMAAALWGILCCLCCVPYGAESAKNSDHYCPNCQRYIGTYVK